RGSENQPPYARVSFQGLVAFSLFVHRPELKKNSNNHPVVSLSMSKARSLDSHQCPERSVAGVQATTPTRISGPSTFAKTSWLRRAWVRRVKTLTAGGTSLRARSAARTARADSKVLWLSTSAAGATTIWS